MIILLILRTAILTIFDGFSQTLRVFALPSLIGSSVYGVCFLLLYRRNTVLPPQAYFIISLGVLAFCAAWTAVNFHRKVLLDERFGWIPRLHVREMAGYAMMCIPFILITLALMIVSVLFAGEFFGTVPLWRIQLGLFPVTVMITAIALGLFAQLPPIAAGRPMGGVLRQARSRWLVLLGISVILAAAQSLFSFAEGAMLSPILGNANPRASTGLVMALLVYSFFKGLVGWAFTLSLLTVIYEYLISSRLSRNRHARHGTKG